MTKDEALKLALEALVLNNDEWKSLADSGDSGYWKAEDQNHYKQTNDAITAIKEALAQPAQDAVALTIAYQSGYYDGKKAAQPTQRPWVYLTDEHIKEIVGRHGDMPIKGYTRELFDRIEAKLREKNT